MSAAPIDWKRIRERLAGTKGREYWRSLEELAGTEAFEEFLQREFPQGASEWLDPIGRRRFLQLAAASLALAGLSACTRQPEELIVPYVQPPEELVPGKPLYFATATELQGFATGVLAESHMGRPTELAGNALHPASLGALDVFSVASILELYDPDRSQVVLNAGSIRTWDDFIAGLATVLDEHKRQQGAGLRLLTRTVTSPTLASILGAFQESFPRASWIQYEPLSRENVREGARRAFGEVVEPRFRLDRAEVIVSLDADFLGYGPGRLAYARDFARHRRADDGEAMSRLYVVEPTPSLTGAMADHKLPLRPVEVERFARVLASRLSVPGVEIPGEAPVSGAWLDAVVEDLESHRGRGLVLAGEWQPPAVHALAHAMNAHLGNAGESVFYTEPIELENGAGTLAELAGEMEAGEVDTLLILDANPVYDAPVDLDFASKLASVNLRVHLGLYADETSELCHWHVPLAHPLESWGDARAFDGTVTLRQPLIDPLYQGKTTLELLSSVLGQSGQSAHDILRGYWSERWGSEGFEARWRRALHDGIVTDTPAPERQVVLRAHPDWVGESQDSGEGLQVVFRPDPSVFDGRFSNNGWLQELPRPFSKLTWDNAALVSPRTAEELDLGNEEVVELRFDGRSIRAPVWILPGQAEDVVTVHLGYGRTRAGRVGSGVGFDAYRLRVSEQPFFGAGLELRKTGERHALAVTQHHHSMEGRHLVREADLDVYRENPLFAPEMEPKPPRELSLYPARQYEGYSWGMAIDLNSCIGCNACTVACQSENNIPVVGKEQVQAGREMHWIRVDHYFQGGTDNPRSAHQPVPCMHCENAPCEVVCPVAATVHGPEGLNQMVYNRCVGTRYCSNNCPYKVRRFNFLLYSDWGTPVLDLLRNPDVTVRSRGVMEKCTYCVQRITKGRIQAEKEDRRIRDGEVVTACQAVCPTEAIVFGDLNDPESRVNQAKSSPRNYGILEDLNTRPRTTYLARLRNPHPQLEREDHDG